MLSIIAMEMRRFPRQRADFLARFAEHQRAARRPLMESIRMRYTIGT